MKASKILLKLFFLVFLLNTSISYSQQIRKNLTTEDIKGKILRYGGLYQNQIIDGCEYCAGDIYFVNNNVFIDVFSNLYFFKGNYKIINNEVKLSYNDYLIEVNYDYDTLGVPFKSKLDYKEISNFFPENDSRFNFNHLKNGINLKLLNNQLKIFNRISTISNEDMNGGQIIQSFQAYYSNELYDLYKKGILDALEIPTKSVFKFPLL